MHISPVTIDNIITKFFDIGRMYVSQPLLKIGVTYLLKREIDRYRKMAVFPQLMLSIIIYF